MFEFEAPKVKTPSRSDVFGKPGAPLGTCNKCKKNYNINELQKYYTNPNESYWLCARCAFKKRMREKLSGRI